MKIYIKFIMSAKNTGKVRLGKAWDVKQVRYEEYKRFESYMCKTLF